MRNRRTPIIAVGLVIIAIVAILVIVEFIIPGLTPPINQGTPKLEASNEFGDIKTKPKTPATSTPIALAPHDELLSFVNKPGGSNQVIADQLFTSCTEFRGSTATPTQESSGAATMEATVAATESVTEAASGPAPEPDYIVMKVVADESEACYAVGEYLINKGNQFNLAIGVTKAINGEAAIDRANLANSRIGEIIIDISQFKSDNPLRDGTIRRQFLESNKYPLARLTNAKVIGLPPRAYKDGETLDFQIAGTLEIHNTKKDVTFDTYATLTGDTLVVHATTNILMTDFGFDAPAIAGSIKANNEAQLILNLVLREPAPISGGSGGGPVATQSR